MSLALALTGLLAAAALAGFSVAFVSDDEASGANGAAAGRVALTSPGDGSTLFTGTDLRPGILRSKSTAVTNGGDIAALAFLTFGSASPGSPVLFEKLRVKVVECASNLSPCPSGSEIATHADATLDSLLGDHVPLGRTGHGASRHFDVQLRWPVADDDPNLYGQGASFPITWSLRSADSSTVNLP